MTEVQQQILEECYNKLREHFDSHIIVADIADVNDEGEHETTGVYDGGIPMAMGLCIYHLNYLKKKADAPRDGDIEN